MSNELDPQNYHMLNSRQKKIILIVALVLAVLIIPPVTYGYYKFGVTRPAQGFKETVFEIHDGETVEEISNRLLSEDLVNSSFLFKAYLRVNDLHQKVQAGIYEVPAGASIAQLADIFMHGTNDVRVTFLEGWRVEEIAKEAERKLKRVDAEQFIRIAKKHEGYLFPDTYFFNTEVTEQEVVDLMLATFEDKTSDLLTERNFDAINLTEEEIMIFASIVEREVNDPEDRPIVAGILVDRWENGELLGADATTQYAVADESDWWPKELTVQDLDSDSPFNTRKNLGLPPQPIASPSLSAIEAVINHRSTEYNYYLTDSNGITHYAVTLEEHNLNIARYL